MSIPFNSHLANSATPIPDLVRGPRYHDLPLAPGYGPFASKRLAALSDTLSAAWTCHARLFAVLFDLYLSSDSQIEHPTQVEEVVSEYVNCLYDEIRKAQSAAFDAGGHIPKTTLHYVWASELTSASGMKVQLAILVNNDAFFRLGKATSRGSDLAILMQRASQSLVTTTGKSDSWVSFPENPTCTLPGYGDWESCRRAFCRLSTLCHVNLKASDDIEPISGSGVVP